jgi:hypothetical protein
VLKVLDFGIEGEVANVNCHSISRIMKPIR